MSSPRPPLLSELAQRAREIYDGAVADLGEELGGYALTDLLADHMTDVPLETIDDVIVVAGLAGVPSCPDRYPFNPDDPKWLERRARRLKGETEVSE